MEDCLNANCTQSCSIISERVCTFITLYYPLHHSNCLQGLPQVQERVQLVNMLMISVRGGNKA